MGTIKEMDVQRRLVAYKTAQAWNQIPHVAFSYEPDVTGFYEEFRTLRPKVEGLSLNTLLIKAVAEGLKAAPALNSALAFDHRAFDFGDIVPFIRRLDGIFQKPEEIRVW